MKKLLQDKTYLVLQILSLVMAAVYLILTGTYHQSLVFASWIGAVMIFLATGVYCAVRGRWTFTSINLAAGILLFMSLMVLPYNI